MSISIRTHSAAGVALVAVGALLAAPTAPAPEIRSVHSVAVMPTAAAGPINPIEAFSPVVEATIRDLTLATMDVLADPMPITRQLISNSVYFTGGLAYATVKAGATLSSIAWDLPATLGAAGRLVRDGDLAGAIAVIEDGTIGRALEAANQVIRAGQQIMRMQADILGRLSEAVPEAARAILTASAHAVQQIGRATVTAFVGVVEAAKTRDLTATYNAVVTGVANVADVTRAVTIGTSSREADEVARMELKARSILGTMRTAQRSIADALNPRPVKVIDDGPVKLVKDEQPVARSADDLTDSVKADSGKADNIKSDSIKSDSDKATTTQTNTTKAKPGADLRKAMKSVRQEVKAAVAKVKKALAPKPKKTADATE